MSKLVYSALASLKNMTISKIFSFSKSIHKDSLHRNSLYLIASQLVLAILGFFFWVITAHLFTPLQVGIATTLISVTGFITGLSQLGFNQAIIRYFAGEEDKNFFVNTSYMAVTLGAVFLTVIFILGVSFFSPPLLFLRQNLLLSFFLVFFMVIATLNTLTDSVFIALRNAKYIFIVNCFVGITKLILPVLLMSFGALGIFYAYTSSVTVGAVLSFVFLWYVFKLKLKPMLKKNVLTKVWKFTLGTYLAGIFSVINATLVPILITNKLGPTVTAYYYMPSMIMTLLIAIPRSTSSSMFAEASNNEKGLNPLFFKSLKATYILLIPAALINIFLGQYILLAFGKTYSVEGITYLRFIIISLLISVPNYMMGTVFNIEKRIKLQLIFGIFGAVLGLTLTLSFISFGLNGLGVAAIVGQAIMFTISSIVFLKTRKTPISLLSFSRD